MTEIRNEPSGLGGWLILPAIGLCISPLVLGASVVAIFAPIFTTGQWQVLTDPNSPNYHPLWAPLLILELCGNIFFLGFNLILLVMFFSKYHAFPKMYILYMALNVLFVGTDFAVANQIPAVAASDTKDSVKEFTRALIGAAIWIPYFLVSKRVKNTFVRPEHQLADDDFDEPLDDDRPGRLASDDDEYKSSITR